MILPAHLQKFANPIPVLDKGYVKLEAVLGDDEFIVKRARTSTGKDEEDKSARQNRALIRRLMRDRHTGPFEFCELVIKAKMPIFVARQWVR